MMSRRIVCSSDSESDGDGVPIVTSTKASSSNKIHRKKSSESSSESTQPAAATHKPESKRDRRATTYSESKRLMAMTSMKENLGKGLQDVELSSDGSVQDDSAFTSESDRYHSDDSWDFSAKSPYGPKKSEARGAIRGGRSTKPGSMFFKGAHTDHGDKDPALDGDSDDGFIVGSEEEREEEEAAAQARREDRAREKARAKGKRRHEKERRKQVAAARAKSSNSKPLLLDSRGNPIKRIVLEDEEEEEEAVAEDSSSDTDSSDSSEEEEEKDSGRKHRKGKSSSRKTRKRRRHSGSGSSSEDSEENSEDAVDGPMLYWQVDAMRNEKLESNPDSYQPRQSFSAEGAMASYIELLARSHLKSDAIETIMNDPSREIHNRLLSAARQIENKICTMRESLLGSGAWAGGGSKFAKELQSRPFYLPGAQVNTLGNDEKCAACNRTSKSAAPFSIYLFGCHYNAREAWVSNRWQDLMPQCVFFHHDRKRSLQKEARAAREASGGAIELSDSGSSSSDSGDDDSEEESDSSKDSDVVEAMSGRRMWWVKKWPGKLTSGGESTWSLSGHCKGRTQLYHALLHYKLRLLLKVRERLEVHGYSLTDLTQDQQFINHETRRYSDLLDLASTQFGGANMDSSKEASIKRVWADGVGEPGVAGRSRGGTPQSSSSSSQPRSGGGSGSSSAHQSGMLNFLVRNDKMGST